MIRLLLFTLVALSACTDTAPAAPPSYQDIDRERFSQLMEGDGIGLIDVRTPPEIAEGKIADALEMDFKDSTFASRLEDLDPEKDYLVYCRSGRRSAGACELMREKGFTGKLYNLDGGYLDWTAKQRE